MHNENRIHNINHETSKVIFFQLRTMTIVIIASQTHPKLSDLNASGQISLSCHKEIIKLTHHAHIAWNPSQIKTKMEQGTGDWQNPVEQWTQ